MQGPPMKSWRGNQFLGAVMLSPLDTMTAADAEEEKTRKTAVAAMSAFDPIPITEVMEKSLVAFCFVVVTSVVRFQWGNHGRWTQSQSRPE